MFLLSISQELDCSSLERCIAAAWDSYISARLSKALDYLTATGFYFGRMTSTSLLARRGVACCCGGGLYIWFLCSAFDAQWPLGSIPFALDLFWFLPLGVSAAFDRSGSFSGFFCAT